MNAITQGAPAPAVFSFDSHSVRTILVDEQPWFVAADVCSALGIANVTQALARLDDDEQALCSIEGLSRGNDQANIINESGLYSLVLGSRKPTAKRFKKWVTSEVLPAIRKTGRYEAATAAPPTPSLLSRRWLITFDHEGRERVTPIDPERFFLKMEELPELLRDPGFMIDGKLLVEVVHACADRLASKLGGRSQRVAM